MIHTARDEWASYTSNKMKKTYELLAIQLDPNRQDGEGRWRMDGGVEEEGRSEVGQEEGTEAERTKEERKEGGSEAGRRKEQRFGPSNEARDSRRRGPA